MLSTYIKSIREKGKDDLCDLEKSLEKVHALSLLLSPTSYQIRMNNVVDLPDTCLFTVPRCLPTCVLFTAMGICLDFSSNQC